MEETIDRIQKGEEELDGQRDGQRQGLASGAGATATDKVVELGSYEYYRHVHDEMDWAPEEEVVL